MKVFSSSWKCCVYGSYLPKSSVTQNKGMFFLSLSPIDLLQHLTLLPEARVCVTVCVCGSGLMSWRHNQQEAPHTSSVVRVRDGSGALQGMTAGCTHTHGPCEASRLPLLLWLALVAASARCCCRRHALHPAAPMGPPMDPCWKWVYLMDFPNTKMILCGTLRCSNPPCY